MTRIDDPPHPGEVLKDGVLGGNLTVIAFAEHLVTLDWRRIAFLVFRIRAANCGRQKGGST
jgi:plasmid maintenance system antidote protein VapI